MFTWLHNRSSRIRNSQKSHITPPLTLLFLEELEQRDMLAASIDAFVVPGVGNQGDQIAMSAQASTDISGASLTYTWNFGDGTQQSGVDLTDVTHAYTNPSPSGTPYTVMLTVTDGSTPVSATSSITIDDVPPTINAGPSQTVRAGDTVAFNGTATDAGGPSQITSIQWDFNYNGSTFNPDPSANDNLTPSHVYSTPGTYVVAMQATDQSGAVSQDFTAVTVKPTDALIVNAGADLTATAGQSVSLSGSYSDPGGSVSSSGIAWDTNYDGSNFYPTVTGTLTPSVAFSTPGEYQVALQITDNTGASDISVLNVTVQPVSHTGPMATAGADQTINEGSSASFSGSYTDPDGTVSAQNIAWDFNYDGVSFNPMTTGTLTPTYQFTTPGDYTVALQITDSNGLTSLSTLNVTVNAVPPTVSAGSNMTVTAGQLVQFSGSATVPSGANDPLSYAWDFNYDGTTFNPGSANTLNPYHVFTTPGTYTVALQATDSEGISTISRITVTVNASNSLVVNAGADQALNEGDTASFSGSFSDGSGTVNSSTAQWDFNYNGTFVADPSASGTLTPAHQFTTPGTYVVALQLTDSNNVTGMGLMYVYVADVPAAVDAGTDQTVNPGATVQFAGTASEPAGANDPLTYAWDFDYDGNTFVAASNSNTLTPTNVYTTPGTYEAALQVTDAYGQVSLETVTVTVNDVAPTATVTNSGATNAGSAVTFTVSHLQDQTPGDTPTYLVDWTGNAQFEELTPDEITTNPDGSISFTRTYDAPSGVGGYNAVVRIVDGSGGYTDYMSNVVVNDPTPAVTFRPNVPSQDQNSNIIDSTVPFVFNVMDPSLTETQAGFTYYVSLDGGAYTSSSSPAYLLPSGISLGQHTVTGYVKDSLGVQSAVQSWTGTVQAPVVNFTNAGTGQLQLSWTGGGPVTLSGGQSYQINGTAAGLNVVLLTSGAEYQLQTNGSIDSISAASGVTGVQLAVDTGINDGTQSMWVGDGHVGTINAPANSSVNVSARGYLSNITGPTSNGTLTGVHATDLVFANLDGSITGVDSINTLTASGWLGTSASQLVEVSSGITNLSAYGVGATVIADARQDAGDPEMQVNVGDGGVPGVIEGGKVGNVTSGGNVNRLDAAFLAGNFTEHGPGNTFLGLGGGGGGAELPSITSDGDVTEESAKDLNLAKIDIKGSLTFDAKGSVKVQGDIIAGSLGNPASPANSHIAGDLTANNIRVTEGSVGSNKGGDFDVDGNLKLNGQFDVAQGNILGLDVGKSMQASSIIVRGQDAYIRSLGIGGDLTSTIQVPNGSIEHLNVEGSFLPPAGAKQGDALISAKGDIGVVDVGGRLGKRGTTAFGKIVGLSIEKVTAGYIYTNIESTNGNIGAVGGGNSTIYGNITAIYGNVGSVTASELYGNIAAKSTGAGVLSGNIGVAHAVTDLKSQSITADTAIEEIIVSAAQSAIETQITAQSGGVLSQDGTELKVQALVLSVGFDQPFRGSVIFTYGKAPSEARVIFAAPSTPLLKYS